MTRRSRLAGLVAAALLALLVPTVAVVMPAAAAGCAPSEREPVKVRTVPALPGASISVEGQPVELTAQGTATVRACPSSIVTDLVVDTEPFDVDERTRARYDRVFVSDAGRAVSIAFHLDYLTGLEFQGLPRDEIDSYTLQSSTGQRIEADDEESLWLWGSRVVRSASGLQLRDIYYTIRSVMVRGTNVVNQSQVKFFPRTTENQAVELLTFQLDIQTRDRLFGFPVGRTAWLEASDGSVMTVPLESGAAVVTPVPRGTYIISVDAPGLSTPRPLSVSRDQMVDLPVLTYLDIAVLLGLPSLLGLVMILAPRPHLRSRLAFWRRLRRSRPRSEPPRTPSPPRAGITISEKEHLTAALAYAGTANIEGNQ